MQVLQGRREIDKKVQEFKGTVKVYLKRHPLTAKYAKEPFLTYIVYAGLGITLSLGFLPFLALSGKPLLICIGVHVAWEPTTDRHVGSNLCKSDEMANSTEMSMLIVN